MTTSMDRSHAIIHVEGIACLSLDVDTARKTNTDANVWMNAIPGVLSVESSQVERGLTISHVCDVCMHLFNMNFQHVL
jgi:hypothetical protein